MNQSRKLEALERHVPSGVTKVRTSLRNIETLMKPKIVTINSVLKTPSKTDQYLNKQLSDQYIHNEFNQIIETPYIHNDLRYSESHEKLRDYDKPKLFRARPRKLIEYLTPDCNEEEVKSDQKEEIIHLKNLTDMNDPISINTNFTSQSSMIYNIFGECVKTQKVHTTDWENQKKRSSGSIYTSTSSEKTTSMESLESPKDSGISVGEQQLKDMQYLTSSSASSIMCALNQSPESMKHTVFTNIHEKHIGKQKKENNQLYNKDEVMVPTVQDVGDYVELAKIRSENKPGDVSKCKVNASSPNPIIINRSSITLNTDSSHHDFMVFTPEIRAEEELSVFGKIVIKEITFVSTDTQSQERFKLMAHNEKHLFETSTETINSKGVLRFQTEMVFYKLRDNFEINLKLCSTKEALKTRSRFSFKRFFKISKKSISKDETSITSPYKPIVTCTINIFNLRNTKILEAVDNKNTLTIKSLELDYSDDLVFSGCTNGYLSIATKSANGLNWNTYWCILDGYQLKYYSYSSQEEPKGCVDLRYCVNAYISESQREICPRTKTLQVEVASSLTTKNNESLLTASGSQYTVLMYFLHTNSSNELNKWKNKLNMVLSSIRNWNKMQLNLIFKKVTDL